MKRLHLEQLESNGFPRDEKRAHLPDNYMKALNNEKFELRLLIPSSCCGAVIGKRGENVQLIREKVGLNLMYHLINTFILVQRVYWNREQVDSGKVN